MLRLIAKSGVMGQIKSLLLEQLETDLVFADRYWLMQEQFIEPPILADEAENTLPIMNSYESFNELELPF